MESISFLLKIDFLVGLTARIIGTAKPQQTFFSFVEEHPFPAFWTKRFIGHCRSHAPDRKLFPAHQAYEPLLPCLGSPVAVIGRRLAPGAFFFDFFGHEAIVSFILVGYFNTRKLRRD
jgi:hypothetical protein